MSSAALLASGRLGRAASAQSASNESFTEFQERRRKQLWSLLGDLPWQHTPETISRRPPVSSACATTSRRSTRSMERPTTA